MKFFISYIFCCLFSINLYSQINSLANVSSDLATEASAYHPRVKYYHAGEIGNRHGKNFEISFDLMGSGIIVFYKKDYAVAYSGNRPEVMMIDNLLWFNSNNQYIPSPRNWVSTYRYNFSYPTIDDVEGNCSVQTESYSDRFLLHIYNSNGFNKIRLFLPFSIR
jgi:hypothetical protein